MEFPIYISTFIKNRLIEKSENAGGGYLFNQVIHDGNCFKSILYPQPDKSLI